MNRKDPRFHNARRWPRVILGLLFRQVFVLQSVKQYRGCEDVQDYCRILHQSGTSFLAASPITPLNCEHRRLYLAAVAVSFVILTEQPQEFKEGRGRTAARRSQPPASRGRATVTGSGQLG